MEKPWKCPYTDRACNTHALCKKCKPLIVVYYTPAHTEETVTFKYRATNENLRDILSAIEEMLSEFARSSLIFGYVIEVK